MENNVVRTNTVYNGILRLVKKLPWFFLGITAVFALVIPYIILQHGVYIQMTDQLDGEVLNYIYNAKYLFSGSSTINELMNGVGTQSMTPPAPLGILFYKLLTPFAAFACMHVFVLFVGYVGMYLLIRELTDYKFIAAFVAVLFVYLPFYPVYGLSVLGQPLFLWALIKMCREDGFDIRYLFAALLYGVCSSLALTGFGVMLVLGAALIYFMARDKKIALKLFAALFILASVYLLCNFGLIKDIFTIGGGFVAHREEMILSSLGFAENFLYIFLEGGSYAKSYNLFIFVLSLCVILSYPLISSKLNIRSDKRSMQTGDIALLLLFILVVSLLAALWRIEPVTALRMRIGGSLKSFQADRIYWLLPVCWYMTLGLCLKAVWEFVVSVKLRLFASVTAASVTCVFMAFLINTIYQNSTIYHNLRLMIFPDTYKLMDWDDYYACDVFGQIDEFLGEEKSVYRTVSLGISPAAALYNGFYCLDGYSNYYPLDYKHEFREIIAKELEKSEELRVYFDAWGNRCYLFNGETGNYMMIPASNDGEFEHLDLNTKKLYEMGGRYIFSALPIKNSEELNLKLLRDEPFATDTSYYEIYLYEVLKPTLFVFLLN